MYALRKVYDPAVYLILSCLLLFAGFFLPVFSILLEAEQAMADRSEFLLEALVRVQLTTLRIAAVVGSSVTFIATVLVLLIWRLELRTRKVVLFFLLFPMGVHISFRVFGIHYLLGTDGPTAAVLNSVGILLDPSRILFTELATDIGLVHWLLPLSAMLMYVAITNLSSDEIHAAFLLGASWLKILRTIVFPQLVPSIVVCFCLTFSLAYGSFITPAALGGIDDITISRFIGELLREGRSGEASVFGFVGIVTPITIYFASLWLMGKIDTRTSRGA